jgi:hypothetical protein
MPDFDNTAPVAKNVTATPILVARVAVTTSVAAISGVYGPGVSADGVVLATGDAVLFTNLTSPEFNGLWVVGVDSTHWVRHASLFTSAQAEAGVIIKVLLGTTNNNKRFRLLTVAPITLNTTPLTFEDETSVPKTLSSTTFDNTAPALKTVSGATFDNTAPGVIAPSGVTFDNTSPSPKTLASTTFDNTAPSPKTLSSVTFSNTAPGAKHVSGQVIRLAADAAYDAGGLNYDLTTIGTTPEFPDDVDTSGVVLVFNHQNPRKNGLYLRTAGGARDAQLPTALLLSDVLNDQIVVDIAAGTLYGGKTFVLNGPYPLWVDTNIETSGVGSNLIFALRNANPKTISSASFSNTAPSPKTLSGVTFDNTAPTPRTL